MVPLHRLFTVCCLCASVFPQYTHLCMYMCMYVYVCRCACMWFTCHCVSATLRLFRIDAKRVAIANDASLTAGPKLWSRFPNTRDEHTSKHTQQQSHMFVDSGQ